MVLTMVIMLSSFTIKQPSPETSPKESTRYCYIYGYGGGTFEYHVIFSNVISIPSSATKDELIDEFEKYCLHSSSF